MAKIEHDYCYGIIPLQKRGSDWYVLLLCHEKGGYWAFPKGHSEGKETETETALRELKEETDLEIDHFISSLPLKETYQFMSPRRHIRISKTVTYFMAEVVGNLKIDPHEIKDAKWVPITMAEQEITYPESKNLMKKVVHELTSL